MIWSPPKEGWVKYNLDGCSKGNPSLARERGVIRNDQGKIIEGYPKNIGFCSNNVAEVMAIWCGLKRMKDLGFIKFFIEGDSKLIIYYLNGKFIISLEIRDVLDNSRIILQSFLQYKVQHSYKEGNQPVDAVTNEALKY